MRTGLQKRFIVIILASLFAIILTAGCIDLKDLFGNVSRNGGDHVQPSTTGGMYGLVTDAKKMPLSDVSVSLTSNGYNYSDMTDKYGRYNVTGVQPGTYKIIVEKAGYKNVTLPNFTFMGGYSYPWNVTLARDISGLYGIVTNLKKVSLENVSVMLIGNVSNYSDTTDEYGRYNITGIQPGVYKIVVEKAGYKNTTLLNFTFIAGSYPWNVTLTRDCLYYPVNASVNYVVRYGCNGTIYRGDVVCTMSYPEEATYTVFPQVDGKLSVVSTSYWGGNRMLNWKLDNSDGHYSYVQGYAYIDMKGTRTMQIVERKEIAISAAASGQPNYLGRETLTDAVSKEKRTMIEPSNSEIKAVAERVKSETGSDDTWTVARALFLWLKENTQYYHGPESAKYTQSAIETLHNKRGDCDELSYLYISLLRAAGIPARYVDGYFVSSEPDEFISHTWVEFYDGEWVPVEVATTGVFDQEKANWNADQRLGIQLPDHIATFVDDGSGNMRAGAGAEWLYYYYDKRPSISSYTYFKGVSYDSMDLAVCADGTRTLTKDKG